MAVKHNRNKQAPTSPWCNADVDVESLTANERTAHELVVRRRDLTPSVERIMSAALSDASTAQALAAFSAALNSPGDPNRDPSVAIASAQS